MSGIKKLYLGDEVIRITKKLKQKIMKCEDMNNVGIDFTGRGKCFICCPKHNFYLFFIKYENRIRTICPRCFSVNHTTTQKHLKKFKKRLYTYMKHFNFSYDDLKNKVITFNFINKELEKIRLKQNDIIKEARSIKALKNNYFIKRLVKTHQYAALSEKQLKCVKEFISKHPKK